MSIGLDLVWEFLSPLLTDKLKDVLKSKESQEIAKKRTFLLYNALGEVVSKTDTFVNHLEMLVKAIQLNDTDDSVTEKQDNLFGSVFELKDALKSFEKTLDGVLFQMEIHKPNLVRDLQNYQVKREKILGRLVAYMGFHNERRISQGEKNSAEKSKELLLEFSKLHNENDVEIIDILKRARKNQGLIHRATKEFRGFLAREFPYIESF